MAELVTASDCYVRLIAQIYRKVVSSSLTGAASVTLRVFFIYHGVVTLQSGTNHPEPTANHGQNEGIVMYIADNRW